MKINILGTEYHFEIANEKEDACLIEKDGYCDAFAKRIVVEGEYNENHPDNSKDLDAFKRKVIRHEIVHAMLFESGLSEYGQNEQLVDWIAWQFPKMLETFREAGAL